MPACQGEQTYISEPAGYGPQVVLPRSLMKFAVRLNGVVQADCTMIWAMKNWIARIQTIAPCRIVRATSLLDAGAS